MKISKKIISMLLVICMVLSMSGVALAENEGILEASTTGELTNISDNTDSQTPEAEEPPTENQETETTQPVVSALAVDDVINYPLNSIVIKKTNAITGELLAGAVFEVSQVNPAVSGTSGTIIGRYTTDYTGVVVVSGLEPGGFIVKEVQPPTNYLLSENSTQQAWLKADGTSIVELTFSNYPYGHLLVKKVSETTGEPLSDTGFFVTTGAGTAVGENGGHYVTDHTGSFLISNLKPGSYVVREEFSKQGYLLDTTPQTIQIGTDGKTYSLSFSNKAIGGLLIKKYDTSGRPLGGAVFRVTDISGAVVGTGDGMYTTDFQGNIYIPDLKPNGYKVVEVQAPAGYKLSNNSQTIQITDHKIYTLEFVNEPLNNLTVVKKDGDSLAPLANATIKITKADDTFIAERTTDSSGKIMIDDLEDGFYKIFETKAPSNYILDGTVKLVNITGGNPAYVELYNYKMGSIEIQKVDALNNRGLQGAVYEVRKIDGTLIGSNFTTDTSGNILIPNMSNGWFTVTELTPPTGYQNTPQNPDNFYNGNQYYNDVSYYISNSTVYFVYNGITYYSNGTTAYYIENGRTYRGYSDDSDVYTYTSGSIVRFRIDGITYYAQGSQPYYIQNGTTYKGFPSSSYWNGNNYDSTISNGTAVSGYILQGSTTQNVQVKSGNISTITFKDYQYATLTIKKTDFVTKKPIKDVKFSVVRDDGKMYGEYYTDQFGEIVVTNKLEKGTYIITEVETVDGYKLDPTAKRITLNWGDTKRIEWNNYPYGSLKIHKYDANDNNKPIEGVEFELYDSNKNPIGRYSTDGNGEIYLPKQFEAGSFSYRETKAPEGYLPIEGLRSFEINWGKTTTLEVSNIPIEGQIEIIKKSAGNNTITGTLKDAPLQGVEFTVFDINGNMVEKLITDGNGRAISQKLRYGKYTVKETKASDYYVPNTDVYQVFVDVDGKVYTLELFNTPVSLAAHVEKNGYAETMSGDTVKYELYNIQNLSNVALDNFYLHDSIPVDAVRITRIFTGTYNQNLNYKIMYKTNLMGEYKVLKDNLFTDKIYEIDCSHYALGLQANEYVTDIKFEFGTVKVGFRETERPFIYAKVNDGLPHGYKFTNTVAVGGRYKEQIVKADDKYTTSIYNISENKGKLPKTGY